jgi:predicted  nucleic acid-binding Zn-ribbon protein
MENQVSDITTFLKGIESHLDQQYETLKQSLDMNTSTLRELIDWKPQVQAEVKGLRSSITNLQAKVEVLTLKQEEVNSRKVFTVDHLDFTSSTSTPQKELPQGGHTQPLGHDSNHDH